MNELLLKGTAPSFILSKETYRSVTRIKKAIWLYFFLLLFEGGLRKWVVPSLSNPLLIIRDPVALWIIFEVYRVGLFPKKNFFILFMTLLTIGSCYMSLIFGHGDPLVVLYGARISLLHFPLIFLIGKFFTKKDVEQLGRVLLWISIPMTVLLAVQFYSPQSAFVNRGIGGNMEGSGFSGAMGFFRASTTFSFTSGTTAFFAFTGCFVFYFWLSANASINRFLLIASTICLVAALPLSISRSLFFSLAVTIVFIIILFVNKVKTLLRIISFVLSIAIILFLLSKVSFFETATMAFTERFTSANASEGGVKGVLLDRFLGGMLGAVSNSSELPFWGYGLGMGTNVGAKLMTGNLSFLISEGEWGRLLGEMGLLLGMGMVVLRANLTLSLMRKAYRDKDKSNFLPWILFSFGCLNILQGQWAQPTSLGFATLAGGLIIASMETNSKKKML